MTNGSEKWTYPPYPVPLPLSEAYEYGLDLWKAIEKNIEGGVGCGPEDSALLSQIAFYTGFADHLEIGTLFGSTAIQVAKTKKEFDLEGDVYCIDNFSFMKEWTSPELVMENASKFDVADRIHVVEANSWPLPAPVNGMTFGSVYIDAGHDFGHCQRDWLSVKDISSVVAFHDYDQAHMGVVSTVRQAMQEPRWWLVYLHHHTAIMERL
jgi:hypothetical protein